MVVSGRKSLCFPYIRVYKSCGPHGGAVSATGSYFEHTLLKNTSWRCIPNIKVLGLVDSDKKCIKVFIPKHLF